MEYPKYQTGAGDSLTSDERGGAGPQTSIAKDDVRGTSGQLYDDGRKATDTGRPADPDELEAKDEGIASGGPSTPLTDGTQGTVCGVPLPQCLVILKQYVVPPLVWTVSDVADIVSDIMVAASHYRDGNRLYFGMTMCFVFAPSLAIFLLALNSLFRDRLSTCWAKLLKLVIYALAIVALSLWPVASYLQMVYYGIKAMQSKEKRSEYVTAWKRLQDESLPVYYVIKAFLECAPQLALQLYILLSNPPAQQHKLTVTVQIVSCTLSLVSMAGKSIKFRKYIQQAKMVAYSDDRSSNCTVCLWNTFLLLGDYLWWFCSITARMVAIVLFASVFHAWVLLVCLAHAIVMVIWLLYNQRKMTPDKFFVSLFVGIMYVFCFVEYKVDFGRTSVLAKYAFYYLLMVCQNTGLVLSAYFLNDQPESSFLRKVHHPLVIVHYVATLVDLVFMVGYLLHSKRDELLRRTSAHPQTTYTF